MKHKFLLSGVILISLCLSACASSEDYPYHAWDGTVCSTYWDFGLTGNDRDWDEVVEEAEYVYDVKVATYSSNREEVYDTEYIGWDEETDSEIRVAWLFTPYLFTIENVVKQGPVVPEPYYGDYDEAEEGVEYYLLFLWGPSFVEPSVCYSNTEKLFPECTYRICLDYRFNVELFDDYGSSTILDYGVFFTSSHGNSIRLIESNYGIDGDDFINEYLPSEEVRGEEEDDEDEEVSD
ncbi:MAG: hypothetical protein LUC31_03340 [Coprobacillus sp.]|nr:hypothetical protein [Coprobacillus sp.]